METIEININDQLYVNNKWYFDVTGINDNIIQVRIQYKENPNINTFIYKKINLDKSIFTKVEELQGFTKCEIDEKILKKTIGNLITRIKVEKDYSFIFEDGGGVATSANSGGMGAVVSPGINSTPGVMGTAGSADISTTLGPSTMYNDLLGKSFKQHEKDQKKKKKKKIVTPIIQLENLDNKTNDNTLKTLILDMIDYPVNNEYDLLFIKKIKENSQLLMSSSSEVIKKYINDLIELNKSKIKYCSEWFVLQIEKISEI